MANAVDISHCRYPDVFGGYFFPDSAGGSYQFLVAERQNKALGDRQCPASLRSRTFAVAGPNSDAQRLVACSQPGWQSDLEATL